MNILNKINSTLNRLGTKSRSSPASPVIPVLQSAEVPNDESGQTSILRLLFDTALNEIIIPDMSSFVVKVNSITKEMGYDGISNGGCRFNLYSVDEGSFAYGDIITVSYTAPALNPLQGLDGGKVASFEDYPVVNNVAFTPQYLADKLLYWGAVADIAGGEMPNKLTGATDALTVGGSEGSYTFQTPDTAPYIAADTDYIWFKTDETLRTATEAELVGYDFPRTLVKYDNTTPYAIREIIILLAGETLTTVEENLLRDYMELSIWWSGVLSDHGNLKGNRGPSKSAWTPESVVPANVMLSENGINELLTENGLDYLITEI
jgi:hypothetical protein